MLRGLSVFVFSLFTALYAFSSKSYEEGLNFYKNGEYSEALNFFQKVVQEKPNDAHAWYNLALCQKKNNALIEAICSLEKANKLNPCIKEIGSEMDLLYQKLNLPYTWSSGVSAAKCKFFRIPLSVYFSILLVFSVLSAIFIFIYFKRKRRLWLSVLFFSFCCSMAAAYLYQQKYELLYSCHQAVVLKPVDLLYLSEKGNVQAEINPETAGLIPGNRIQIGISSKRTEILLENGETYWLDSKFLFPIK